MAKETKPAIKGLFNGEEASAIVQKIDFSGLDRFVANLVFGFAFLHSKRDKIREIDADTSDSETMTNFTHIIEVGTLQRRTV